MPTYYGSIDAPATASAPTRHRRTATALFAATVMVVGALHKEALPNMMSLASRYTSAGAVSGYGSSLDCELFDDDGTYPFSAFGPSCFEKDYTGGCERFIYDGAAEYMPALSRNCAASCPPQGATVSFDTASQSAPSYMDICAWQGVAELPKVCDGSFVPAAPAPGDSLNLGSSSPVANDYMQVGRGGCGAHSFCMSCYDSDGSYSDFCDKVLDHYATAVDGDVSKAVLRFWDDVDSYWCPLIQGQ